MKKIKMILTLITNSSLLKWAFGYSFAVQSLNILTPEGSEVGGFLDKILNAIPSKIIVVFGIVYGIAIVIKKGSQVYKQWELDRLEVKQAKETLEQKEIQTEKDRKEL